MRRVIHLALKDILQVVRDWQTALFLLIMPIVFTFFFGFIFDSNGGGDPRLAVAFIDRDPAGELGANLQELLAASEAIRPVIPSKEDAQEAATRVQDQDWAAVVIVPEGFGEGTLEGDAPQLTVIVDPDTPAGRTALNALGAATTRLLSAVETAQLSTEAFEDQAGFEDQAARQAYLDQALALSNQAWRQPPLTVAVEQASGGADEGETAPGGLTQSSPGMIVQFAVFGLIQSAMVLVLERKSHTLQRMLTTPITRAQVIGGHVLAMFLVVLVQEVTLIAVGQFVFGVDYLRAPVALLMVMLPLALWSASLGLLIGAISDSEDQVIMWSLIAMFVFAALGGAWFPLEITGEAFATVGHLMPTAWAMDGFQDIVVRGLGLAEVLRPAAVLWGYALLFFVLGVWRFKFALD